MISSIELQVISKILTSDNVEEVNNLCSFDSSYYSVFKPQIEFILNHKDKYGDVPDVFTFQAEFPDVTLVSVDESFEFISDEMKKNKQHIILIETFNKLKDLGSADVTEAWQYISNQCDRVSQLDNSDPMDIVHDAAERSAQLIEYSKQSRIPTGFPEIDKLMYGGLSTVEELLIILARTNTGKSWICTKMMESAQKTGFPVLYYSPEMQASYLGSRFDTWRGNFLNSQIYLGRYNEQYMEYIKNLSKEETPAFVLEDKDMPDGVTVPRLENLVRKHGIKLLIIDGLSYMEDTKKSDRDYEKYKNICTGLFRVSKKYGCAVVLAMQANRATNENKDAKGDAMPTIYNAEGSDHPGRIATQVFAVRQIFDKHVLDIRLEKSRIANNQKPMVSYSWDPNSGRMQYLANEEDISNSETSNNNSTGFRSANIHLGNYHTDDSDNDILDEDDLSDDVEF